MTYFGFLVLFLGIPILGLVILAIVDVNHQRRLPELWQGTPFGFALFIHILIAVIYTTPWDNYLVATGVWFYNPDLVTGITIGWVPIEEYIFFVLQTLMTGLLFVALARRLYPIHPFTNRMAMFRAVPVILLGILWAGILILFVSGWVPGTYLSLILLWALPPIMLQFAFGGDILWYKRKTVGLTVILATLYLCVTDSLAIGSGTWTIDPDQSMNIFLAGVLPLEEFVFFLVTNCLIIFGITLFMATESRMRFSGMIRKKSIVDT